MGQVAKAEPDGHVVGMATVGTHAINPSLYRGKLPFRVPDDFTPITLLTTQANVVLVNPGVPSGSIGEFVAWAKANPGALYGSAGIGTSNHLAAELMSQRFGLGMVHVPYRGAAPVTTDLLAGRIQMTMENIGTASQMAEEGKLKALAVTTAQRSPRLPDVPTLAESGAQPGLRQRARRRNGRRAPAPVRDGGGRRHAARGARRLYPQRGSQVRRHRRASQRQDRVTVRGVAKQRLDRHMACLRGLGAVQPHWLTVPNLPKSRRDGSTGAAVGGDRRGWSDVPVPCLSQMRGVAG
jgi:hypothetical protein